MVYNFFRNICFRVLNDPEFKFSAMQMSEVHRNKPMHPLDSAIFWIEHTISTGGAYHLRTGLNHHHDVVARELSGATKFWRKRARKL